MNVCVHGETTAHDEPGEARCAGPSAALPFRALEAILLLGVGFVIRPTVDALAAHDWLASAAGIAYLVIALRRIVPRLPLSLTTAGDDRAGASPNRHTTITRP